MDSTIYAAYTGMAYRTQALNVTGNNLANMETPGFKKSKIVSGAFGEYLAYRIDKEQTGVGNCAYGAAVLDFYLDFSEGNIHLTGGKLDLALNGAGFFTVMDEEGKEYLTRNGRFALDMEGFLVDEGGLFVAGQNGRIQIQGEAEISEFGEVLSDGEVIDTLKLVTVEDEKMLHALSDCLFDYPNTPEGNFEGKVARGYLESSNVTLIDEISDMIVHSRAFQSCAQAVKMADEIRQKTANEIGKV